MRDLTPKPSDLDPIEIASRDKIAALQLDRLRWSLAHAYENVAHYRQAFDAAGVHPDDLHELSDLAEFPFTVKQDLRDNYPFGMFAVPRERIVRVHASSGTTGRPTVVGYTSRDIDTWATVVARSMRAAGTRPGDVVHVAYGYGLFTGGLGAHYGRGKARLHRRSRLRRHDAETGAADRGFRRLHDHGDALLRAFDPRRVPRAGPATRAKARSRWASSARSHGPTPCGRKSSRPSTCTRVDIYGLSEVMGPGVASECVETKDGLHIWEDHFYPEVIDPRDRRCPFPMARSGNSSLPRSPRRPFRSSATAPVI